MKQHWLSINITCNSEQRKSQKLNLHVKAASQIQANTEVESEKIHQQTAVIIRIQTFCHYMITKNLIHWYTYNAHRISTLTFIQSQNTPQSRTTVIT